MQKNNNRKKNLICVFLLVFMRPMGFMLYLSAFPQMTNYFQVSKSSVQLTLVFYSIGVATSELIYGFLSDIFGRKKILLIAIFFFSLTSFVAIFCDNIKSLFVVRLIQGLCFGANFSIVTGILKDIFPKKKKLSQYISLTEAIFGFSMIIMPFWGSYLLETFGTWKANFVFMSMYSLLVCILISIFYTETNKSITKNKPSIKEFLNIYTNINYLGLIFALTFAVGIFPCFDATSPFIIEKTLNFSIMSYGQLMLFIGIMYFVGCILNTIFLRKISMKILNNTSLIIYFFCSLLIAYFGYINCLNIYTYYIPSLAIIFVVGFLYPNLISLSMMYYPKHAALSGANVGFFSYLGSAIITATIAKLKIFSLLDIGIVYFILFLGIVFTYQLSKVKFNKTIM